MKVLVLNCGSSSVKYQFLDMQNEEVLAKGIVERVGKNDAFIKHKANGKEIKKVLPVKDHQVAIDLVLKTLIDNEVGVIKDFKEIDAVGHRVVHAGEKYASSVKITDDVINKLKECINLAPLHNPANIKGIEAITKLLPDVFQVAVFDTAFHQTMEKESYLYALPYEYYEKYEMRRYGFHGTSHRFVSRKAASDLGLDYNNCRIITCHIGNGASIAAIKNGKSVDTSMGFTPLEGLVMGTRCGDIDPAIVLFLIRQGLSVDEVDNILNKKSGVLGITGYTNDMREIEEGYFKNDEKCVLATKIYARRIKKYIGAYMAILGGVDIIVFTGGVGENMPILRKLALEGMEELGIILDEDKNNETWKGKEGLISKENSKVKVIVVPTNEELLIARDTVEIYEKER